MHKLTDSKTYSAGTSIKEWEDEFNKNNSSIFIILKDETAIGDFSYDKNSDETVDITGFAIEPQFQGQGIGKKVIEIVMEDLKDVKTIRLFTHPENSHAIKLYLSFGFVIKSWKDNYFGDGEPRIEMIKENSNL